MDTDETETINKLRDEIHNLQDELNKTKDHLKKYTAPSNMKKYYNNHKEFFEKLNLSLDHPYLTPGSLPVAELEQIPDNLIDNLKSRQWVKSINLI